jgi:alkanesulfonate monooxygenase SsuD/methylene tetrahydromethanopterin reductase-like flavin-dependent oxidoreductase (luciferase family)
MLHRVKFGLTLPNRGVLFGVTTPEQMLQMAEIADRSERFQSVWVGDSLLGKPRLESIALLSGIAARTRRVRLGPACMASFTLRDPVLLAYQWASLDVLAQGRTVLVTCTGLVPQAGGRVEGELYGLQNVDRVRRLTEWITLVKKLWTEDNVCFEGQHYRCQNVTIEPKPAHKPRPPIWIANNAPGGKPEVVKRTLRRVARHADGWETSLWEPKDLAWRMGELRNTLVEEGRDPSSLETHLYHNINVNEDREAARGEAKRFLDTYYSMDYRPEYVAGWTATGSPEQCADHLRVYRELGFDEVTLRVVGWDQFAQLARVLDEVLPRLVD